MNKPKTPKADRPRLGRPPLPPGERMVVSAVRMKPAHWEKFYALGGIVWLRERIERTKA